MRTTLTLDDDVAARLKAEARRVGRPFREVANETLRKGLTVQGRPATREPFEIRARDLGSVRPGLSLDNVGDLIEQVEGPPHR